jgi:hypothetical protein
MLCMQADAIGAITNCSQAQDPGEYPTVTSTHNLFCGRGHTCWIDWRPNHLLQQL